MSKPETVSSIAAGPAPSVGPPPPTEGAGPAARPNPEVSDRPIRRKFSAAEKLRILAELDRCTKPGEIGSVLRREGLYSSVISRWRRQQEAALTPARRGPKPTEATAERGECERLKREIDHLKQRLAQAEAIIDIQKKVSALLGIPLKDPGSAHPD